MKAAVTDGMKRAFRSFGVQFGNDFYGDQPSASAPQPERVPAQPQAKASGNGRQSQAGRSQRESQPAGGDDSQTGMLRNRIFEIAGEQGIDEDRARAAVAEKTGKSIDDLTAAELGPLVKAAANKLRQMKQARAA